MSTTALYIAAGTLLGLVQMAFGLAIGLWIHRDRRAGGDDHQLDGERAAELIGQLTGLTSGLSQEVQGHQRHISRINDRLTKSDSTAPSSLTEVVVGVVGEVLRANRDLQDRLSSAEAQLQQQSQDLASYLTRALTDEMTGLPNRRAFDEQLRQRLDGFARHHVPFSLMLVDVDHFKSVNDTHGHVAGDLVLCEIGQSLRSAMRKHDVVARYGGEEFAVLLPYTSLDGATHAARHARRAVQAAETHFEGTRIQVTASAGVASARPHDDPVSIVKRADDALYASKSGGRNCGHLNDGERCQRIFDEQEGEQVSAGEKASGVPSAPEGAEEIPDTFSEELAAACAELRDFAANVDRPSNHSAAEPYCKL